MDVYHRASEIHNVIAQYGKDGKSIGFVPTMGALHEGHLSLIRYCLQDNDVSVASIFVNPTQFNRLSDFEHYPRDLNGDLNDLSRAGIDIVFNPSEEEIYPEKDERLFDFGYLDQIMEGKYRPGHFNGVAQVVSRLFAIVQPHKAYFGEKDYQQLVIIRKLTRQLKMNIDIVACPIVREPDGLAKSSRNNRLTPVQREHAAHISKILFAGIEKAGTYAVEELKTWAQEQLNRDPYIRVEYLEIMDDRTLKPVQQWDDTYYKRAFVAAWVGDVRLIDNVKYYF